MNTNITNMAYTVIILILGAITTYPDVEWLQIYLLTWTVYLLVTIVNKSERN